MLNGLYRNMGTGAVIILCLAIILLTGFFLTRITRLLKLPNVTAYIFAGIIIGPYALNLVPVSVCLLYTSGTRIERWKAANRR